MKLSSNNETGGRMPAVSVIDPAPRPTRRTFTGAYKLATVAEYEAAPHGQKNAVLRREGLYHSHIVEWAAARDAGALSRAVGRPKRLHRWVVSPRSTRTTTGCARRTSA